MPKHQPSSSSLFPYTTLFRSDGGLCTVCYERSCTQHPPWHHLDHADRQAALHSAADALRARKESRRPPQSLSAEELGKMDRLRRRGRASMTSLDSDPTLLDCI